MITQEKEKEFADIKATISLEAPDIPQLNELFVTATRSLTALTRNRNKPQSTTTVISYSGSRPLLPLVHHFFERNNSYDSRLPESVKEWTTESAAHGSFVSPYLMRIIALTQSPPGKLSDGKLAAYNIKNWPTSTSDAHCALKRIERTHTTLPIPAFTRREMFPNTPSTQGTFADWSLVMPGEYEKVLINSTVFVNFQLLHYAFKSDRWHAIPTAIRILNCDDMSWGAEKRSAATALFGSPSNSDAKKQKLE
jgi:hypothetical protein